MILQPHIPRPTSGIRKMRRNTITTRKKCSGKHPRCHDDGAKATEVRLITQVTQHSRQTTLRAPTRSYVMSLLSRSYEDSYLATARNRTVFLHPFVMVSAGSGVADKKYTSVTMTNLKAEGNLILWMLYAKLLRYGFACDFKAQRNPLVATGFGLPSTR